MPLHKNQVIPLTIHAISSDGNGVGRHEGEAVFVPAAAVGDLLRVRIVKPAKRYAYGKIEQVVTPGPGRIKPDCPVSASCGGCAFRHLSYPAELAAKQGFVQDALKRIGGIEAPVAEILPSPQQNHYRNKVQYPVAAGSGGLLTYGFYAPRSHRVVPCANCLLQPPLLNQIAARTAALLNELGTPPYNEATHQGLVRHLYLRQSHHSGQVMLCLVLNGPALPREEWLATTLAGEFPQIHTVVLNVNQARTNVICGPTSRPLLGSGAIQDQLCGVPLQLGVHSFSQVNPAGAQQLFGVARQFAAPAPSHLLLDLYCGTGVIGLSMAAACRQLIGVDVVPEAIEGARRSAFEMGLGNARFLCDDATAAAQRLAREGLHPDIVTVDPPRKGMDTGALHALLAMAPARVVMVSCNPATLARDLAALLQNGYRLTALQPVDMFPRTKHVECVAALEKNI